MRICNFIHISKPAKIITTPKAIGEFDSDAGQLKVFLFCPSCLEREQLPMLLNSSGWVRFCPAMPGWGFQDRKPASARSWRQSMCLKCNENETAVFFQRRIIAESSAKANQTGPRTL